MKAYVAGLLTGLMACVLYSLLTAGSVKALRRENQAAREWADHETSRRLAITQAFDSLRAASRADVTRLTQRTARTGVVVSRLVDSVYVIAPPDCEPYLREIRDTWLVHLAADDSLARAVAVATRQDSVELVRRAAVADSLTRDLHAALNRTDAALDLKRGHGWVTDALLVAGTLTLAAVLRE